nr:glycosyltransferase family 4 protein [Propionibacterium sp.]
MTGNRIVHLSTVHHTRDNRIFNKEVPALLAAGFDVTLAIRADADESFDVPLVALPTAPGRLARLTVTQIHAWRALNRLRPALLHIHDPELIPLAWAWARRHRARCVFDAHEDLVGQVESKDYLNPVLRPLARAYARALTAFADRHMDGIVAATESIAALYGNPNTVLVRNFPWLADYDIEPAPVPGRLVYVGDLSQERKLSFMVALTRRLREFVPAAHLVLAGRALGDAKGTSFDGEVVRHLGLVPPAEIPAVLASAQVGLIFLAPQPNYTNSLPTKLFEYMAAGVPFAASDFPFWRDTFGPLNAGVFLPDDVDAAAAALAVLLADPARCAELGSRGRAAVRGRFDFVGEAARLEEFTRRLVPR